MGIRGLQSFMKKYSRSCSIDELLDPKNAKLRIGIDALFYIYRWRGDVEKFLEFLRKLQANKQHVILVFDGKAEDSKAMETQKRRETRDAEIKSANQLQELIDTEELTSDEKFLLESKAKEHKEKGWSMLREERHLFKERLYQEKIPMIKAKGEADSLLAAMSAKGDIDLVISGDMDLVAMGAKLMWAPQEDGYKFCEFDREMILDKLSMTDWQFRTMCAMCFTEAGHEYNSQSVQKVYDMIQRYKSIELLRKKNPTWLNTWPEDNHILYQSVNCIEDKINEAQVQYYKAYMNYEPMPYT
jgi:5'-3' exonuclease